MRSKHQCLEDLSLPYFIEFKYLLFLKLLLSSIQTFSDRLCHPVSSDNLLGLDSLSDLFDLPLPSSPPAYFALHPTPPQFPLTSYEGQFNSLSLFGDCKYWDLAFYSESGLSSSFPT